MIYALVGAALVGVSLGLLGSGGAILTVPVLVYLAGHPEKEAITESLAIVGAISVAGALLASVKRRVHWPSVLIFAPAGMAGAWIGATISRWVPGAVQLLFLSALMLGAAVSMARDRGASNPTDRSRPHPILLVMHGCLVGIATGLVGVGGGFLIVPALVLLVGLPMQAAVGTSLCIIALNTGTGFIRSHAVLRTEGLAVNWTVIGTFAALGIAGVVLGSHLGSRVPQHRLRQVFAILLVVVAGWVVWAQLGR